MKVAVLAATGMVGREAVKKLAIHPDFEIDSLIGNSSINRHYGEVWRERENKLEEKYPEIWKIQQPPKKYEEVLIEELDIEKTAKRAELVFSFLPSTKETENIEKKLAKLGVKVYSASNRMRLDKNISLVIAEVNPYDLRQIRKQKWQGSISKKPNCLTTLFVLSYFPIYKELGLDKAEIHSFQSLSGMGDNGLSREEVLKEPRLEGEEKKTKEEPYKIMNLCMEDLKIEAFCQRVYVAIGHKGSIKLKTKKPTNKQEVINIFESFNPLKEHDFHSSPNKVFIIKDEPINPIEDIKKDGMSIIISDIEVKDKEISFNAFSNNLDKGAAGGLILNAELGELS